MPSVLKVTADENLATPEAVRFRLGKLREELASKQASDAKGLLKRIMALRMRLPDEVAAMAAEKAAAVKPAKLAKIGKASAEKLLPAVRVACLASKADIYEFSSPLSFR